MAESLKLRFGWPLSWLNASTVQSYNSSFDFCYSLDDGSIKPMVEFYMDRLQVPWKEMISIRIEKLVLSFQFYYDFFDL